MRKKEKGGKDAGDAELDPVQARFRQSGADIESELRHMDVEGDMEAGAKDGKSTRSAGTPEGSAGNRPEIILVPDSHHCRPNYRLRM